MAGLGRQHVGLAGALQTPAQGGKLRGADFAGSPLCGSAGRRDGTLSHPHRIVFRGCRRAYSPPLCGSAGRRDDIRRAIAGIIQSMPEPPHSAALRRGRCSEHGRVYLITTTTQARQPVFVDFGLARAVIAEMRKCDSLGRSQTLSFVLMPDHVHWLVQLQVGDLSSLVARFKANSAKAVNRLRGHLGLKLWQTGFHDHALRRDEDLAGVARYIVANPLRAGLVASVGDYPHWDAAWI